MVIRVGETQVLLRLRDPQPVLVASVATAAGPSIVGLGVALETALLLRQIERRTRVAGRHAGVAVYARDAVRGVHAMFERLRARLTYAEEARACSGQTQTDGADERAGAGHGRTSVW